jgi:hypothetical protein
LIVLACSGEPGELQDRAVHDADQDQGEDAEGERAALRPIIWNVLRARSAGEREAHSWTDAHHVVCFIEENSEGSICVKKLPLVL